ncbi:hypothetical protein M514_03672, partial [Trichuris suis]
MEFQAKARDGGLPTVETCETRKLNCNQILRSVRKRRGCDSPCQLAMTDTRAVLFPECIECAVRGGSG